MSKVNIIDLAHALLMQHITSDSIIVDATCGNGYDTLFLANQVKHVHAFDIQKTAIENSRTLTRDLKHITFYLDSHENIHKHITDYHGVIFNLGYLPGGDKSITTHHVSTINTLKNLHQLKQGFVLIVAYPGHIEGMIEQVALQSFLDKNAITYRIIRLPHITKSEAPIIYFYDYTNQ